MVRSKTIDDDVMVALQSVEWDGAAAMLTCGQLDRKTYVKVNDVLESLGGKWNRKAKAHVFDGDAQDTLEATIETGSYTSGIDLKQFYGEFETPDALADELVKSLDLTNTACRILEPSAGGGRLIQAVQRINSKGQVTAIEIQPKRQGELAGLAREVVIADFLSVNPQDFPSFDFVVVNPPFAKQADIDHVSHAMQFLAEGGRLAAIMSAGWTFRTNRKSYDFQELVAEHGTWRANPEDAFRESGTGVNTVTVVLEKSRS